MTARAVHADGPDPAPPASTDPAPAGPAPAPPAGPAPVDPVQRWVELGIITADQAAAIRADQAGRPPAPAPFRAGFGHTSLVAEALGYLGGAIILVALGLASGRFWPDLSTGARIALAALVTVGLVAAGLAVPASTGEAPERLRSVLWLLSTGTFGGLMILVAEQVFGWHDEAAALFMACGTAMLAAVLWWRHHHLLQHLAVMVTLVMAAGTSTALLPDSGTSPVASIWAVGVAWYLLGWGGAVRPRRETELIGAVVAGVAAAGFAVEPWGSPLAIATVAVMALLAVRLRDLPLLVIAAIATLNILPAMVTHYFPGLLSAAVVLLIVGVLLVAAAVVVIRTRGAERSPTPPRWSTGTPAQGAVAAGLVLALTATAVLAVTLA